jgi:hypothetical protein
MTHNIVTAPTESIFFDLVDLIGRDYVSPADFARIDRLARIVAKREGVSRETVMAMATAELVA